VDELRRAYHDRITGLRDQTIGIVRDAATSVESVTAALLERDRSAADLVVTGSVEAQASVATVESEVLDILAQQSPVARDLRVVLASLRIAQVAELCLGLSRTLATRAGRGIDVMTSPLRALIYEIGAQTSELLHEANGAWITLDEDRARAVIDTAAGSRDLQRRFLAELLGLSGVPTEAAVDLGMAARVYQRLIDHAVEIAGRVVFAVTGSPPHHVTEATGR